MTTGQVPLTPTGGRSIFRSVLREPLVHFLLLGALLFALDAWLRPGGAPAADTAIVVGEARVRSLSQNFARVWQRPPTRIELEGLVEDHVREEVLVREALVLGLDRDDAIVRRRLRQKMEFISDETAALAAPTEKDLADFLAANPETFNVPGRVSFAQVYLDPARRGPRLEADAKRLLGQLNRAGATADPAALGDALRLLEARYENLPQFELERLFGEAFAKALFQQPIGTWVGPVASGYGEHLVRVESKQPGGVAALADVRPLVEREWANARRKTLGEAYYARLRAKYRVEVRMPAAAQSGARP